jgi:hypothetical protein
MGSQLLNRWSVATCALISACSGAAQAQSSPGVYRGESLRPFWDAMSSRRTDVICLGDSNQLYRASGWDDGWTQAIDVEFGLYATGLHALGENRGLGAGVGSGSTTLNTGGAAGVHYQGAPLDVRRYVDTEDSGLEPQGYAYIASGTSVGTGTSIGLSVTPSSPLGVQGPMRWTFSMGTFTQSGGLVPVVRDDFSRSIIVSGGPQTTQGDGSPRILSLDIPAGSRAASISLLMAGGPGASVTGPFVGYYARAERTDRAAGGAVHTLYGVGGQSARDMAGALQSASDHTIQFFLAQATALQNGPQLALVRINSGLNDRNEEGVSLGLEPRLPGDSPGAFLDNVQAIMDRLKQQWVASGASPDNLYFLISVSHPVGDPDDTELLAYRRAADEIAKSNANTASVHLDVIIPFAELKRGRLFAGTGEFNHLGLSGFRAAALAELRALRASAKEP